MTKILSATACLLAATLIATPALAAEQPATPQGADPAEQCAVVAKAARTVMMLRQQNKPMADMVNASKGNPIIRQLVLSAYKQERYFSPEVQQDVVTDFANQTYATCFRTLSE